MSDMPQDPFGHDELLWQRVKNGVLITDQLTALDTTEAATAMLTTLPRDDMADALLVWYADHTAPGWRRAIPEEGGSA